MELQGKIKVLKETETFGSNGFRKRELVITTNEQYPQMILVEFVQDKCDVLNNYKVGQDVKIGINLRGREWINPEGVAKYFNTIQGWRIEAIVPDVATAQTPPPAETPSVPQPQSEEDSSDLPF